MFSYDEIDALILNRWRETNDGSFIEQFTDDEIEGIAQYISKHKKADFRASDRADKEGVIIDYVRLWAIDLLLLDKRDDLQELASILEWY